jgi:hypothetical protein
MKAIRSNCRYRKNIQLYKMFVWSCLETGAAAHLGISLSLIRQVITGEKIRNISVIPCPSPVVGEQLVVDESETEDIGEEEDGLGLVTPVLGLGDVDVGRAVLDGLGRHVMTRSEP